jgi:6-phosphogluconolactonase (cycloisomerase 2 family)
MWVLGTKSNQIGGFKIDNFTGNLTGTVGSPYDSGGVNPVMLTLKSGGRFLYVLNAGDSTGATGNFSLFSVGGDGTLTFQQSYTSIQGTFPVWITTDTSGNYLFVLSQRSPAYDGKLDFNGSITAFSLDSNTGRPSLITNAQVKNAQGTQLTYFEVGKTPTQMRNSASCIYTLDSGDQTIFPYSLGTSNGQLTQPTNSTIALNTANATSVNIGGNYVYVTDAGSTTGGAGSILPYTQGGACALSPVTGGTTANLPTASYPIQTVSTTDGKFVYVLNHSTASTNYANSSISAFLIQSNGQLQQISDPPNPYTVGSGPVCIAIDPTNEYIYTSDQIASTISGKRISSSQGFLSNLTRGSSFPTVGTPSCFVISPNTGY